MRWIGLAVTAAALALAGCSGGEIAADTPASSGQSFVSANSDTTIFPAGARPAAPGISGTTLAGQHLRLASFRGSVLVINFWGSWCGPCRAEAPGLSALASRMSSQGVRFLGIDIRDDPVSAGAFIRTFGVPYPSLNDPGSSLALAFRQTVPPAGIPTTLVIDRGGRIAARVEGSVSYNGLRALIRKVARD